MKAKIVLTCPKTGEEVVLHKDCTYPHCELLEYFGFVGHRVRVACNYSETVVKKEDAEVEYKDLEAKT